MRRMLTARLQNRSGVLNRFTGVLSRRQVNIESISVGATENPNVSRITIIIDVASHDEVEQIIKQLNRQIDVISDKLFFYFFFFLSHFSIAQKVLIAVYNSQ